MAFQNRISFLGMLGGALLLLHGCTDKTFETRTYMANTPVYMTPEELQTSVVSTAASDLEDPGKIHVKGNYIFVVEAFKGVHVIDNTNPASPQNNAFIKVPGVVDIATKDNVLYADSYTDLVAIDISDPQHVNTLSRVEGVFNQILPPTNNNYPLGEIDNSKGIVVGWKAEQITEKVEMNELSSPNTRNWVDYAMPPMAVTDGSQTLSVNHSNGKSGSMARFTVYEDALYSVNVQEIRVFDVSSGGAPQSTASVQVNRSVETLFPMGDKLFVGTTTGMVIYDLSNALSPAYMSEYNHFTSCDPVVAQGNYAYVTLRAGTMCGGWLNELDVIDISDITNPVQVGAFPMTNPYGLGIDDKTLFVCDGTDGLKVYDASNPAAISDHLVSHFEGIHTYDVIPLNGVLLMVGSDGLYQYDYSNADDISLLSVIPVFPSIP